MDQTSRVVSAAGQLEIKSRGPRWAHTALCILDAVFSINAHYDRHTVPTCHRYAAWAGIAAPLSRSGHLPVFDEQPLPVLVTHIQARGDAAFAAQVLQNNQRTWANRRAPLKAEAARRYAEVLTSHGVGTLADANDLLAELDKLEIVEQDLASVPGHGSGARLAYLWMLLGDDSRIKPDRMVIRWLKAVLHETVSTSEAVQLLAETAVHLGCTPWELDHATWDHQRNS
ncbi:hypothetical protein GCM10010317_009440 [Streptomyces mirabilis]|uniref:hypothetical protein n=1 Tax=Streptomyces mirabilis TaxID=68239 RepID=UPI00167D2F78|nr:hypothetical protein [Streptomyces mirabilis]GHD40437.1 hypothetical protein GCM10010317_009440 [Streptomyces mirabilis]